MTCDWANPSRRFFGLGKAEDDGPVPADSAKLSRDNRALLQEALFDLYFPALLGTGARTTAGSAEVEPGSFQGGAEGVGRAVNQAIVISFMAIGVVNYVFTQTLLATFPELSAVR